jgi:hypothetical protein
MSGGKQMSKYKRIRTEITNPRLLRLALQEVVTREGLGDFEEGDLVAHGYNSQATPTRFVIRKRRLHAYGDLGFALAPYDAAFTIIVDEMDQRGMQVAREVRRSYAILQAVEKAQAQGYTVTPLKDEQGRTLELRLRRYGR